MSIAGGAAGAGCLFFLTMRCPGLSAGRAGASTANVSWQCSPVRGLCRVGRPWRGDARVVASEGATNPEAGADKTPHMAARSVAVPFMIFLSADLVQSRSDSSVSSRYVRAIAD